jgi:aldose 1-epimerase
MFMKPNVLALTLFLARVGFGGASLIGGDSDFKPITISAHDDSIHGSFIPYGAHATAILVDDKDGKKRDILLGYDDPLQYKNDTDYGHPYFAPVVGRYANRIRNGTFTIPITKDASGPNPYQIINNEHNGAHPLTTRPTKLLNPV